MRWGAPFPTTVFVLTQENALSQRFHFKVKRKSMDSVVWIFKIALRLRDWHAFMWQLLESLNVFTTLSLTLIFWKTKTFFKKQEYRFLVQSTKIKSATFPHKTAFPEDNVKTNRMGSTKWTYHKRTKFCHQLL